MRLIEVTPAVADAPPNMHITTPSGNDIVIRIDPEYFRPSEVDYLLGDSTKARQKLGWSPRYTIDTLIEEMMQADFKRAKMERSAANWNE